MGDKSGIETLRNPKLFDDACRAFDMLRREAETLSTILNENFPILAQCYQNAAQADQEVLRLEQLPDRSADLAQARADQMEARAARERLERSLVGIARRLEFVSRDLGSWHDRALQAAGLADIDTHEGASS